MSFFKKFAWSGAAVVLAAVMALGLLSQSAFAALPLTTSQLAAVTVSKSTNAANGTGVCTPLATAPRFTEAEADDAAAGTITLTAPAGWSFCAPGSIAVSGGGTITVATSWTTALTSATMLTATNATGSNDSDAASFTWNGITVRPNSDATATGNITSGGTLAAAASAGTLTIGGSTTAAYAFTQPSGANALVVLPPGSTCDATGFALAPAQPVTVPADGSASWVICTRLLDDVGNPASGSPVTFTVSLGVVSTGTAKTVTAFANSTGYATTTYRGAGNNNTTDSVVATFNAKNAVATQTINLAAASGGTASKIVFNAPVSLSVAATVSNTTPGYITPVTGTNVALQVQDGSGLGVNGQVLLLTVDKGGLVAGFGGGCPATTKSITSTSATGPLNQGGTDNKAGVIALTFCANQTDAAGKATITAQNISTSMANATQTVTMAGRPAKVEATATGNSITAKVSDAGGNAVADGTPVRFTISANAGATSLGAAGCTTTTNGQASAVISLIQATGTVIVSTDWNESGANAASCVAGTPAAAGFVTAGGGAGAQQLAASVAVPGGSSSSGGTTTPGAGSISSGAVPAAGGFGLIVASGDIKGVVTASGCPSATAAFWATVAGNFLTYVPGTTISAVNADFLAAFKDGILPAATPLIGKCK